MGKLWCMCEYMILVDYKMEQYSYNKPNGLGIIRHIAFLDDDFKKAHPEMPVEKNQIPQTKTSLSGTPPPFIRS